MSKRKNDKNAEGALGILFVVFVLGLLAKIWWVLLIAAIAIAVAWACRRTSLVPALKKMLASGGADTVPEEQPEWLESFRAVRARCSAAATDEELIASSRAMLDELPKIDGAWMEAQFAKADKYGTTYKRHPDFGTWNSKTPYVEYMRNTMNVRISAAEKRIAARAKFAAEIEAIQQAPVAISPDAKASGNSLANLPVVSPTNITAKFNPANLPVFVVFDVETTGLSAQNDRIVELSAVKFSGNEPIGKWSTLVNPGIPIPERATQIHGIMDSMVADAPAIGQVAQSFLDFVGNAAVVAYNLPFDFKFLWCGGVDLTAAKRRYYDAYQLSKRAFKDETADYKLQTVARYCGIEPSEAHRSLADCYATGLVFLHCIRRLSGDNNII